MTTEERVRKVIAEQFGLDVTVLSSDTNLMDGLGADSLDIVELQMFCEQEFQVTIPDNELDDINTVADVHAAVERAIAKSPPVNENIGEHQQD